MVSHVVRENILRVALNFSAGAHKKEINNKNTNLSFFSSLTS